jgi:FtsP/CotA-like multicopper oxidase with cupredoxin domain
MNRIDTEEKRDMRFNQLTTNLKAAVTAATVLLLGAGLVRAQQTVNLTAAPTSIAMPDGTNVPMWGYTCNGVTGTAPTSGSQSCAATNKGAAGWSPVVITVPYGQDLTISLTNNLSFANGNTVPTSLMIVGQLGGGLGDVTKRTTTPSPSHADLTVTWPTAGAPGSFNPPAQGPRVQSFGTEVAQGATTALTWKAPRPGTYLIESGTHPSIQGTMGLYGILVVTTPPTSAAGVETAPGTAYPAAAGRNAAVTYDAEVPLILSEIDPVLNNQISTAINTSGFQETNVWSGQPGGCGNPSSATYNTCYPPVVNYKPLYYLINGVAFSKGAQYWCAS